MKKIVYLTRLLRLREELTNRLTRIDREIEAYWRTPSKPALAEKRGRKPKYSQDDVARIKAMRKKGMTLRKISSETGIPNQTIHKLLKS